jgi:hypothetical protein
LKSKKISKMDAAIRKAKDHIGQMFDKNMHDLVRGIRNHKENESKYIAECMDEIKLELKMDNIAVKTNAIAKLTYVTVLMLFPEIPKDLKDNSFFLFVLLSSRCSGMTSVGLLST